MYNREIKEAIVNHSISVLLENNLMTQTDFSTLGVSMGYIFTQENGDLEALFKVTFSDKKYFFAVQKGKLMCVNIDDAMFEQTVAYMKQNHPCLLNEDLPETKLQKKRREKNNKFVSKQKISTADKLMSRWDDDKVTLKDKEEICKRMLACFQVIQIACDIGKGNYQEGLDYFKPKLEELGLMDMLNSKEQRIIDGIYSQQDAIDLDWAYEAYWSLCWAMGLVKDISDAGEICDCNKAITIASSCNRVDDLVKKCKLRSKEEILDMLDLYFRYNWAVNDAKVNPNASIGKLNPSIVIERRRGLEWLVSDIADWYEIEMRA